MQITIASHGEASRLLLSHAGAGITHVVSINDPGTARPDGLEQHGGRHLVLAFHDCTAELPGKRMPALEHVEQIVAFARAIPAGSLVLVHCGHGVARSSAAALIILAAHAEPSHPAARKVMCDLLALKPFIMPNQLMVHLADEALGWDGRLFTAYRLAFRAGTAIWVPPGTDAQREVGEDV